MRYLPCEACRFDPAECSRRQSVAAAVRGFNRNVGADSRLTAIRFLCPDRFLGYEVGRRVEVREATYYDRREGGTEYRWESIPGWIVQQRGDRVRIFLDEETNRGKRLIWLRPVPARESDTIGVRPLAERMPARDAHRLMVREVRRARGEAGENDFWCGACETWLGADEARYKGGGLEGFCRTCDGRLTPAERVGRDA